MQAGIDTQRLFTEIFSDWRDVSGRTGEKTQWR